MSKRFFGLLATAGSTVVIVGCGASSTPSSAEAASSCDDIQSSARQEVEKAIAGNASCTTDTDCVETGLAADCFDSCSRAVNASGASAVDAVKVKVNGSQCRTFAAQGCKKIIPPCVPLMAPKCVANACQ